MLCAYQYMNVWLKLFTGDADLKSVKLAQKFSWNDHYVIPFVINENVDSSFTWQVLFSFALTLFRKYSLFKDVITCGLNNISILKVA